MSLAHCWRFFCVPMAVGLLVGLAGDAKAQPTYSFTTLDVPGSFLPGLAPAIGINASGQIVGYYEDTTGGHGFLLDQGSYTTLDVPGSTWTHANGINDSGQIVGSYGDGYTYHGFLLDHGSFTTLDVPGLPSTEALGISDSGQIVGYYDDASGGRHGFLATPVP
jgi:probable HAF family extracellular repeat protein